MFRWEDCSEGHFLLGLGLSIISFALTLLTALSTPLIKGIYFLRADEVKFGTFGYCEPNGCTPRHVGYDRGPEVTEWITRTHILFPIGVLYPSLIKPLTQAASFILLSFIALILSVLRVGKFMWNPVYFRSTAVGLFCSCS